jgi:uncharacterized repeat protein (TIGR03803 family)
MSARRYLPCVPSVCLVAAAWLCHAAVAFGQAAPPLVIEGAPASALFGSTFVVSATGGEGAGEVVFSASGACTNASGGPLIHMTTGTGACTIEATRTPDGPFAPSVAAPVTVRARRAPQQPLMLTASTGTAAYGSAFSYEISGGSGTGTVSVRAWNGCVAVESAGLVVMTSGTRECHVLAHKLGDQNYLPVTSRRDVNGPWNEAEFASSFPGPGPSQFLRLPSGELIGAVVGIGALVSFDPGTLETQVLFTFSGFDGQAPTGLVLADDGSIYGFSRDGGEPLPDHFAARGTIFRFDRATNTMTTLYVFQAAPDQPDPLSFPQGASPEAAPVLGSDGLLYGTTAEGGSHGLGTVFRFDLATGALTTLHHFSGPDGANPNGLIEGFDGHLYGTAVGGGTDGDGVLFRLSKTGAFSALHSMTGDDGREPIGPPLQAADGTIYLATRLGGSFGYGSLLSYSASAGIGILHEFNGTDATTPISTPIETEDGLLYGLTENCIYAAAPEGGATVVPCYGPGSLLHDNGWLYHFLDYGELRRFTLPGSVVVAPEQAAQIPVAVVGAPSAAANGTSFDVYVVGGNVSGGYYITLDGPCQEVYSDGGDRFTIMITADEGTCTIVGSNGGDDDYAGLDSLPVAVEALPGMGVGTAPSMTSITPSTGTVDGGTVVTIRGNHFGEGVTVRFNTIEAPSVTVIDDSTLEVVTPAHPVGSVDVTVNSSGGAQSATAANAFVYGPPPTIGLRGAVTRLRGYDAGGLSGDGRLAVYRATSHIPARALSGIPDLYVVDIGSGIEERVNVTTGGTSGTLCCVGRTAAISHDGSAVVFTTSERLVATDTNESSELHIRDRLNGTTTRMPVPSTLEYGEGEAFIPAALSFDGRYVAFVYAGLGLTPNDVFIGRDVFVHDRDTGAIVMISATESGLPGNGPSDSPSISNDGRYVVFSSYASNLAGGAGGWNILLRDRDADGDGVFDEPIGITTTLVSASAPGVGGNLASTRPSISGDGRYVVFQTLATNLLPGDTNGVQDIMRWDRLSGALERINLRPGGAETTAHSSLSPQGRALGSDGRVVVFSSDDSQLVPFDGNLAGDVFRADLVEGAIRVASTTESGARTESNGEFTSRDAAISADGTTILFMSAASNLPGGDGNLFVKTVQPDTPLGQFVAAVPLDESTGGSPVSLVFASVVGEGTTSLELIEDPPPLPEGFDVGAPVYDISTTAVVNGMIEICVAYAGSDLGDEGSLRLMHFVNAEWEDVTTYVDTQNNLVCGLASSLSPFAIAVPTATTLAVTTTPSQVGGATTLTALVSPAGVPGTVVFTVNGGPELPAAYDPLTGTATLASYTHGLNASPTAYEVRARFQSGLTTFASSSGAATLSVSRLTATIAFGTIPTPTYLTGDFVVTASTTNTDDPSLIFSVVSGPCQLVGGSSVRTTGAGSCTIAAAGAATTNYEAAYSETAITVARASTVASLSSTPNPSMAGEGVTITATVAAGGGTAEGGSVTFRTGSTVIASVPLGAGGSVSTTTTALPPGAQTLSADYSGTADFAASVASAAHTVTSNATYTFGGFFAPIDMAGGPTVVWNTANAGRTIPAKWHLSLNGVPVTASSSFAGIYSYAVSCATGTGTVEQAIEEYAAGNSGLIDNGNGDWQYNWKTPKSYAGTCRVMFVRFSDGTSSPGASFKFR